MKRKSIKIITISLLLSSLLSFSSLAGWEQQETGAWKYKDDTTNVYVTDKWIESATEHGLWYYIKDDGIMATNSLIDGVYYVNELGEWRESTDGSTGSQTNTGNTSSSGSLFDRAKDAGKGQVGDNPIQSDSEFDQKFNEGIIR